MKNVVVLKGSPLAYGYIGIAATFSHVIMPRQEQCHKQHSFSDEKYLVCHLNQTLSILIGSHLNFQVSSINRVLRNLVSTKEQSAAVAHHAMSAAAAAADSSVYDKLRAGMFNGQAAAASWWYGAATNPAAAAAAAASSPHLHGLHHAASAAAAATVGAASAGGIGAPGSSASSSSPADGVSSPHSQFGGSNPSAGQGHPGGPGALDHRDTSSADDKKALSGKPQLYHISHLPNGHRNLTNPGI